MGANASGVTCSVPSVISSCPLRQMRHLGLESVNPASMIASRFVPQSAFQASRQRWSGRGPADYMGIYHVVLLAVLLTRPVPKQTTLVLRLLHVVQMPFCCSSSPVAA